MFSFVGAGEDVVKVATTIAITNTVVWEQTTEGTEAMFENENHARTRFYEKLAAPICAPCCAPMSKEEKKAFKRRLSREYYDKDKNN